MLEREAETIVISLGLEIKHSVSSGKDSLLHITGHERLLIEIIAEIQLDYSRDTRSICYLNSSDS